MKMAIVEKPPETVNRPLHLERPVSVLPDNYARFVDCTADYVANFALRKLFARDREFPKWKAAAARESPASRGAAPEQPGKPL
jgi:hypothetical protein